jgi:hypothetical protein
MTPRPEVGFEIQMTCPFGISSNPKTTHMIMFCLVIGVFALINRQRGAININSR